MKPIIVLLTAMVYMFSISANANSCKSFNDFYISVSNSISPLIEKAQISTNDELEITDAMDNLRNQLAIMKQCHNELMMSGKAKDRNDVSRANQALGDADEYILLYSATKQISFLLEELINQKSNIVRQEILRHLNLTYEEYKHEWRKQDGS